MEGTGGILPHAPAYPTDMEFGGRSRGVEVELTFLKYRPCAKQLHKGDILPILQK